MSGRARDQDAERCLGNDTAPPGTTGPRFLSREVMSTPLVFVLTPVDTDDDVWKIEIPGKPLLAKFAARAGMHPARLRKLYLALAGRDRLGPFSEIYQIFDDFAASGVDAPPIAMTN